MSLHGDVRAALRTQLFTLTPFPKIALENRVFEPVPNEPYLRETFKPGVSDLASLGPNARVRHIGLWLLDVYTLQMLGVQEADTLVQRLFDAFPPAQVFTYNGRTITIQRTYRGPGRNESQWYMVPVTIEWWTDSINTI